MLVPENDWIWDKLADYVNYGLLDEEKAHKMELEEAYAYVSDPSNKQNKAHFLTYGVSEYQAELDLLQESYRW